MKLSLSALTAVALSAFTASSCLAATPVSYFFYGFVLAVPTPGTNTPPLYTLVPISVTVDTSYPADTQKDHVTTYSNFLDSVGPKFSPILAATVNGKNVHGQFDLVKITQNLNGVYAIEISSGTPMNGGGFDIVLTTSVAGVVRSDKLPKQIFPGNFQKAIFSTTVDPADMYSGYIVE